MSNTFNVVSAPTKFELRSDACRVEYNTVEKRIFAADLKDKFNEPACYSTSKRGLGRAWIALDILFRNNPNATHRDVMNTLSDNNIRYHYWCMVD